MYDLGEWRLSRAAVMVSFARGFAHAASAGHLPVWPAIKTSSNALLTYRWNGIKFQDRRGPDAEGWLQVVVHPNWLHVGASALRLGRIDWSEVRQLALAADAEEGLPLAQAVFSNTDSVQRLLPDGRSLSIAFAALLTNRLVRVRYREETQEVASTTSGSRHKRPRDASFAEMYSARRHDAAACPSGPCGVLLARRPHLGTRRRELGLVDPLVVLGRPNTKPHWPKAWVFARRMLGGETFPPVKISWWEASRDWRMRDGCHRYFGALVSGKYLHVSFKEPCGVQEPTEDAA